MTYLSSDLLHFLVCFKLWGLSFFFLQMTLVTSVTAVTVINLFVHLFNILTVVILLLLLLYEFIYFYDVDLLLVLF